VRHAVILFLFNNPSGGGHDAVPDVAFSAWVDVVSWSVGLAYVLSILGERGKQKCNHGGMAKSKHHTHQDQKADKKCNPI